MRSSSVRKLAIIYCATANPLQVIVAQAEHRCGILGVVDGSPLGVESADDVTRQIGYKL